MDTDGWVSEREKGSERVIDRESLCACKRVFGLLLVGVFYDWAGSWFSILSYLLNCLAKIFPKISHGSPHHLFRRHRRLRFCLTHDILLNSCRKNESKKNSFRMIRFWEGCVCVHPGCTPPN